MNIYDFYITPDEYEIAESNGICKSTLEKRVHDLMWDKKQAITEKPYKPNRNLDKKYIELAKQNGINIETFASRITKLGWNYELAATTPTLNNVVVLSNARENKRKYPKEHLELAIKNGIKRRTFYTRIERGMTSFEAATIPLVEGKEKARRGTLSRKRNGTRCLGGLK